MNKLNRRMSAVNVTHNKYQAEYDAYERLKKIQQYISSKERAENKKRTDRAVIAAYKGRSRNLAAQVKVELKEQLTIYPVCPYCGSVIGNSVHCDHIYPVSKGGLSVPQNMVYVCSDCNTKKNDLTLAQFIKRYRYSRKQIEESLEKLGKDY